MQQLLDHQQPEVEGAIDLIYGEFGGGKNYLATKIILETLQRGIPVYSSFPVRFDTYDERRSFGSLFLGVLGIKSRYKVVPSKNFHRITLEELMSDEFVARMFELVECLVVIDEGYAARLLDSYRKTNLSVQARMAIYTTRHFDRRILIVAQRPNSIHVSSRAMVNRFYRCAQPFKFLWYIFRIRLFIMTEYQEMRDETVDEEKPLRTRFYIGRKWVFSAFDSKYMRRGMPNKFPSQMQVYKISYFERLSLLFSGFSLRKPDPAIAGSGAAGVDSDERSIT